MVRLQEAPDELGGARNRNDERPVASPPSSTLISLSQLTSRALLDLAVPRPPSTARSRPFDPAAVCLGCLSVPPYGSLCDFGCLQVEGRRSRGRARWWWASFRGHRDRDDGRQDADEEGAQQHRLASADLERINLLWIRPAMCGSAFTGAHQHHHLEHLVHLVVSLEAGGFRRRHGHGGAHGEDRWLVPPPSSISTDPSPYD